jgi:hypothetical protein
MKAYYTLPNTILERIYTLEKAQQKIYNIVTTYQTHFSTEKRYKFLEEKYRYIKQCLNMERQALQEQNDTVRLFIKNEFPFELKNGAIWI